MVDFLNRANKYEFSKAVSRPWRTAFSIHARSFWRWVKTKVARIEILGDRVDSKESLRRWLSVPELLLMCRSESKRTRNLTPGWPYCLSFFNLKFTEPSVAPNYLFYSALPASGGPDPTTTLHGGGTAGSSKTRQAIRLWLER